MMDVDHVYNQNIPPSHDTEECCLELTQVWNALDITSYNGLSASQNVRRIKDRLRETNMSLDNAQARIKTLEELVNFK